MAEKTLLKKSKRFKSSYAYSIISVALVLLLLGITGFLFVNGKKLSEKFKEDIQFSAFLRDGISNDSILQLKNTLDKKSFIKSVELVSKEQAKETYLRDNEGEDLSLLDKNVLPASMEMHFKHNFVQADSLKKIESFFQNQHAVTDFYYEKGTTEAVEANVKKYSMILLIISLIILFIGLLVIDSTIRLAMYSQRFAIRSMQLVGATRSFITKPFLIRGAINGLFSGIIATSSLILILQYSISQLPELALLQDNFITTLLIIALIITGVLFSVASTFFAAKKYLRMQLDELY